MSIAQRSSWTWILKLSAIGWALGCSGSGAIERYTSVGAAAKGELPRKSDDGTGEKPSGDVVTPPPSTGTIGSTGTGTGVGPGPSPGPAPSPSPGPGPGSGSGTATGTGTGTGSGTSTGTGTGTGTSTGTGIPTSVSMEQCTAQKRAWPAVVNGNLPTKCGEPLVDYCCTARDVLNRYPTLEMTITSALHMAKSRRFTLYHCSIDPAAGPGGTPRLTLHLGKIVEPVVSYQTIVISGVLPVDIKTSTNPCPVVMTPDLRVRATSPHPKKSGHSRHSGHSGHHLTDEGDESTIP